MEIYPSSPRELLTMMASTSTQIDIFSDGVIRSVQDGEINPLDVVVQLKAMELASDRIKSEIHNNVLSESDKYPGKEFEWKGNKITKAEHGTKYNFTVTNDPEWIILSEQLRVVTEKIKAREAFLKAMTSSMEVLDSNSGEVVTISPPNKTSKSGINISIK